MDSEGSGSGQSDGETSIQPFPQNSNTIKHEDALAFQAKLWGLLEKRVTLYTSGESSSVPALTAHEMLASVLFVLGIDGDADQVEFNRLASMDINAEFERKLDIIRNKTKRIAGLWREAVLSTPLLESIALRDTLNSIEDFESHYDLRYFAHMIPCDIDYPLCNPVPGHYQGVDYITEYLNRLKTENDLLGRFDLARSRSLLRRVSPEYRVLLINLYEPIATNAIGLALIGGMIRSLQVTEDDRCRITALFEGLSTKQALRVLDRAAASVCYDLGIEDKAALAYLEKLARSLNPRIEALRPKGGLSGLFLSFP